MQKPPVNYLWGTKPEVTDVQETLMCNTRSKDFYLTHIYSLLSASTETCVFSNEVRSGVFYDAHWMTRLMNELRPRRHSVNCFITAADLTPLWWIHSFHWESTCSTCCADTVIVRSAQPHCVQFNTLAGDICRSDRSTVRKRSMWTGEHRLYRNRVSLLNLT